jgi:hypothetical protein
LQKTSFQPKNKYKYKAFEKFANLHSSGMKDVGDEDFGGESTIVEIRDRDEDPRIAGTGLRDGRRGSNARVLGREKQFW